MARLENILEAIGRTPAVKLNRLAPDGVNVYVKVEALNPMGSVKDRLALGVIEDAERRGELSPGQTVIEATSGNTGIGLAMVCAAKRYPLVVTMAENFSIERRKILRFLGAKVILTPASQRGTGMLAKAVELADTHGWFLCRQFENEANANIHSETTAQEILGDFEGERLDYWVTGFGTGGTLKGVARVLKEHRPETKIAVCEPNNSQILGSGLPDAADGSGHPSFRPHVVQGWSPDFIPKLVGDAMDMEMVDRLVPIDGGEAMRLARQLAKKEGIFVGISAGATLAGALQIANEAPKGTTILCMLPDTGERYLTTPLFEDIAVEMTREEVEIAQSTPRFRFDLGGGGSAQTLPDPSEVTPEAKEFVVGAIQDEKEPVVLFALEWCEFCWSLRKMFAKLRIAYRSIDLDSVEYQVDKRGDKIRTALLAHTSFPTIPQLFVGGELVGGCTEVFDAYKEGRLQTMLKGQGVPFEALEGLDPYSFLPSWLHPR